MKNLFKKYDLIKVSGILVLLSVLLTWVVPSGYFSGSDMVIQDITRVGLADFMQYGLLGMYYFTVLITFLFVLGGFYQVLSKTAGYQALVNSISEKLKGFEIPVVLVVSLVLALASSFVNEYFPLLVIVPFILTVMNRMKIDKISAFSATFGSILVGVIGSIYSGKVVGYVNTAMKTTFDSVLWAKIVLFVVAFILLNVFTILHMRKNKTSKKFEEYDKFECETIKSTKKKPVKWTYAVTLILLFVTVILAYLPWGTWEVTLFSDLTKWVNELSLFDIPVISYVFSTAKAFGEWDIFTIQFVMLFTTLLIHWIGKVSWDEVFEAYGEGFKKISYVVVVLLLVYMVLEFAVMFPVLPVVIDWLAKLTNGFNVFLGALNAFIVSLFGVEMQYVMSLAGSYYQAMYSQSAELMAIIFQAIFGFVSFFVPSSAILMMGLAYLEIPYKDWLKHIWKFLVAMIVVIAIIITILVLI